MSDSGENGKSSVDEDEKAHTLTSGGNNKSSGDDNDDDADRRILRVLIDCQATPDGKMWLTEEEIAQGCELLQSIETCEILLQLVTSGLISAEVGSDNCAQYQSVEGGKLTAEEAKRTAPIAQRELDQQRSAYSEFVRNVRGKPRAPK